MPSFCCRRTTLKTATCSVVAEFCRTTTLKTPACPSYCCRNSATKNRNIQCLLQNILNRKYAAKTIETTTNLICYRSLLFKTIRSAGDKSSRATEFFQRLFYLVSRYAGNGRTWRSDVHSLNDPPQQQSHLWCEAIDGGRTGQRALEFRVGLSWWRSPKINLQ